jgi:hypothetical protein
MFFLITSESVSRKNFIAMRYYGNKIVTAPFKSANAFLRYHGNLLYLGGANKLSAFNIIDN